ncbi:MAG: hypothetical protein MMC23_000629 [Stictis urceolatum]|nr:hypothetical protein [Stictis urceolata]
MSAQAKRKRGDSTQSPSAHSPHRPTKRGAHVVDLRDGMIPQQKVNGVNGAAPPNGVSSYGNSSAQGNNSAAHFFNSHIDVVNLDNNSTDPHVDNHILSRTFFQSEEFEVPEAAVAPKMEILSKARQTITEQFSLEILLKHNELRLIDQEIAKCQVALEQLRRCSIVPYPSQVGGASNTLNVVDGMGLPLRPATGHRAPRHPAPWGVTDGPYSRHYSRWLLPDPDFDGGVVEDVPLSVRGGSDRRHRGVVVEQPSRGQASRGRRGSAGSRLHALSSGYPPPKDDKGLAIVTRQSDKKLVKLVCGDCSRENFSSAQGFINHCRIAHSRSFASHEAAAQSVGVEIDAATVESAAPSQTPAPRPDAAASSPATYGLVHPLNRPGIAHVPTLLTPAPRPRLSSPAVESNMAAPTQPATSFTREPAPDSFSSVPFNPSSQTPHLSRMFAKSGRGGDLDEFVSEARVKEDLNAVQSEDDGEGDDSNFEDSDAGPVSHASYAPARTTLRGGITGKSPVPSARPHSRKGPERATRHPGAIRTPVHRGLEEPTRSHPTTLQLSETPPNDLSPHTVESNNAPSLVSDSDDDDYETGNGTSVPSSDADDDDEEDNIDVDFDVEEVMRERSGHVHPGVSVTGKSHDPELRTAGKAKARHGLSGAKKGAVTKKRGPR